MRALRRSTRADEKQQMRFNSKEREVIMEKLEKKIWRQNILTERVGGEEEKLKKAKSLEAKRAGTKTTRVKDQEEDRGDGGRRKGQEVK